MDTKELLQAYNTITKIMEEEGLKMQTSWVHVRSWLSNRICDTLCDELNKNNEEHED